MQRSLPQKLAERVVEMEMISMEGMVACLVEEETTVLGEVVVTMRGHPMATAVAAGCRMSCSCGLYSAPGVRGMYFITSLAKNQKVLPLLP